MKFLLSGKKSLKWSPTTFRLDRARGEHGWNVASSAKRWVENVNGDGERRRSVARATFLDISDGGFSHEFLFLVPECLLNDYFF